jgi:hypothetical protein
MNSVPSNIFLLSQAVNSVLSKLRVKIIQWLYIPMLSFRRRKLFKKIEEKQVFIVEQIKLMVRVI